MRTLFFCNTNYQLLVAMQIAASFDDKKCSVIITTEIKNCEELFWRVRETDLFEEVSTMDVKNQGKTLGILKKCIWGFSPDQLRNSIFDEFVGFNMDIASHMVFAYFYNKNKNIIINKMEEGLMSLNTPETSCGVLDLTYKIRKGIGKKNLKDSIRGFYCFLPQANKTELISIKIPVINQKSKIKEYLNEVFCGDTVFAYKEKYIFLSCIYDIEGGGAIGELELAIKIAERVGKNNLLVKVHPRDDKEKYIKAGLKVDQNSLIPFEVIQINNDFSDKILITTLSASILNFNPVLENTPKCYYGYKLCHLENNSVAQHYQKILEMYLQDEKLGIRNVKILESIEEL